MVWRETHDGKNYSILEIMSFMRWKGKEEKKKPTKPLSLIVGRDVFTRRPIGGGVPLLLLLPVEATPASAEGTGGQAWALPSATETLRGQG